MSPWPSFAQILLGAILIAVALVRAEHFGRRLDDETLRRPWRLLTALMALFVVGFLASLALILADHWQWLLSLTALIFLAGATYVLLSVSVAERLAGALLDDSRRLEKLVEERTAELEAARHLAERASHNKSHYLAEMSHELRTPLSSVVGFANILLKNRHGRFEEKDLLYLERILDSGKHLLALVNDLLDLSRIETGHVEVEREEVALDELLAEVLGQFSAQARGKDDVKLLLEMPEEVGPLLTDRGKLFQVMINLVGNALKFTALGSVRVRVMVEATSRRPARIEVVDTGIGIAPDKLETIFDPFRQADAGIQQRFGGTGLGLNISRSLCRLLGWELRALSDGAGSGSTFRIALLSHPVEPLEGPRRQSDSNEVMPLTDFQLERTMRQDLDGKSVLVVDGGGGLVQEVRRFGMTVFTATELDQAIDAISRLDPDLVIIDTLTSSAGRQLLDHLRPATTKPSTEPAPRRLLAIGTGLVMPGGWLLLEPPATTLRVLGHLWKLVVTPDDETQPASVDPLASQD